ncbi:MAG TPA: hypothetical protein VFB62_26725 [Polyangiaceae bacterium]|nr:hypothetical protein [Polyangiaceae bacterium]
MGERPTIIEAARMAATKPGVEPLTPLWEVALRLLYGLPLTDEQVALAVRATGRTAEAIRALEGHRFAELWTRVGRRGPKSSTHALIGAFEAGWGGHERDVMPGERFVVALTAKDVAGGHILARFVRMWLDAWGFTYRTTRSGSLHVIELDAVPCDIYIFPCTTTAPRGYPIAVAIFDESAHWSTDETGARPDIEILAAHRAAMAQFRRSLLVSGSTPLAQQGVHYDTIESAWGNDAETRVLAVQGPTWEWSPSITEERTRELEPDPRVWRREFRAEPVAASCAAFEPELIDQCFRAPGNYRGAGRVLVIDASGGGGDSFAAAVVTWCIPTADLTPEQEYLLEVHRADNKCRSELGIELLPLPTFARPNAPPFVCFERLLGWQDRFKLSVGSNTIAQQLALTCQQFGVTSAFGDQFGSFWIRNDLAQLGVHFSEIAWTNPNKQAAVSRVRHWLRERMLVLPQHEQLKRELHAYSERVTPSGAITYGGRGQHDDFVALIITAAMADSQNLLAGSPHAQFVYRHVGGYQA